MDNSSPIYTEFLPISRADMEARGWDQLDFVVVGGDAYVDHPSFGTAIISRLLEAEGYKVGVLAQPRYSDCEDFKRFGRPKYGFFIGGGNVDSMVSHYSVAKIPRAEDEYSPGGIGGARPDRSATVYTRLAKEAYPDLPVILGGLEASLRRFAHYDYWLDTVLPSIAEDSGADLISFGMGEHQTVEIARRLAAGEPVESITDVDGTCYLTDFDHLPEKYVECAGFRKVASDKVAYAKACRILVAIVFLVAVLAGIMVPTFGIFDKVFKNYDNLNASVQENVSAIRVVKSFVREHFENEKYTKACESLYKQFVHAESRLSFNNPAMLVSVYGCNIALSWFGAHYVLNGAITTGQLNALFGYIMNILMALMMLSMAFVMIAMSAASARRIVEVLDETTDLPAPTAPVQQVRDGGIEFEHVTFKYKHGSGQPVLNDVTFSIRPGETLGIIGGTGSAKSSLVQLIPRLYDAETGSVKVGGVDVKDYSLDVLRREVSMVLQKNVLFSGTILDNLRWGDENASEEECIRVAKLACADEFIERFPDKYNTWIEQGGSNVSGGQKQRLTIARALLRKPKVLILDDSTSAVDTATDAKIRKAFREEIPGTTKIIIAQRISSVQDADRILVLDNGQINGLGTHEELLKTNKIYQEVYNSQTQGGGDFDKQGGEQ